MSANVMTSLYIANSTLSAEAGIQLWRSCESLMANGYSKEIQWLLAQVCNDYYSSMQSIVNVSMCIIIIIVQCVYVCSILLVLC